MSKVWLGMVVSLFVSCLPVWAMVPEGGDDREKERQSLSKKHSLGEKEVPLSKKSRESSESLKEAPEEEKFKQAYRTGKELLKKLQSQPEGPMEELRTVETHFTGAQGSKDPEFLGKVEYALGQLNACFKIWGDVTHWYEAAANHGNLKALDALIDIYSKNKSAGGPSSDLRRAIDLACRSPEYGAKYSSLLKKHLLFDPAAPYSSTSMGDNPLEEIQTEIESFLGEVDFEKLVHSPLEPGVPVMRGRELALPEIAEPYRSIARGLGALIAFIKEVKEAPLGFMITVVKPSPALAQYYPKGEPYLDLGEKSRTLRERVSFMPFICNKQLPEYFKNIQTWYEKVKETITIKLIRIRHKVRTIQPAKEGKKKKLIEKF